MNACSRDLRLPQHAKGMQIIKLLLDKNEKIPEKIGAKSILETTDKVSVLELCDCILLH